MRIGYVVQNFPALSETFIRREVLALCERGHRVFVYVQYRHSGRNLETPSHPNLTVRQISWREHNKALVDSVRADAIEHLHGTLMHEAHLATHAAAEAAQVMFSITAYSGYSVFTRRDPRLYDALSRSAYCGAVIVEDPFMRQWVSERLGADPERIVEIPNSLDLDLYRPERVAHRGIVILAIARFVEKKGLVHLLRAFRNVPEAIGAELRLIGYGDNEAELRRAAAGHPRIHFLGARSEDECRQAYAHADVFALPCIVAADGDADGVPTVVLEAMACGLPVVTSELLSMPHYVRHRREGLLVTPGAEDQITSHLVELAGSAGLREELGANGRRRVEELCDINRNITRFVAAVEDARARRFQVCLDKLMAARGTYTAERLAWYDQMHREAMQWFRPTGKVLDVGCGAGAARHHMPAGVEYTGCDVAPVAGDYPLVACSAESLAFDAGTFDCVLIQSMLLMAIHVDGVLNEAFRVLKPGGRLLIRENVDDPNPEHLNHLSAVELRRRIEARFRVRRWDVPRAMTLRLEAEKPMTETPLVTIVIPVYNRRQYIAGAVDSALRQTYPAVEVVVVDDGSTDGTAEILRQYEGRCRILRHEGNRGIAAAKNRGLRASSPEAKYVAILDSDDSYHPAFAERCAGFLERNPKVGFVYTDDVMVDSRGREIRKRSAVAPWNVEEWLRTCNLRGDTWMARRELVMRTRLHDERMARDVDYDLFYQLLEVTEFAHLAEYLVYYRIHDGQASCDSLKLAECHAANLVRYGYSPEYAYHRARRNPEWIPAIEAGIERGRQLRAERELTRGQTA